MFDLFEAVLIANRGEIAVRLIRACRELGIRSVAVYSEADRHAPHVGLAEQSYPLTGTLAAESYLDAKQLLGIANEAGVQAVHPGYGFLSEDAAFARLVADAGLVFVGPPPAAIAAMGDKLAARDVAERAGVPVVPGTTDPVDDLEQAAEFGARHGYPVAVKAMFGGGGRGMKVVRDGAELPEALEAARREATASFGRGGCYLERYLERPRHIEVQVLADAHGTTIHLGDRDCSLQRRHQKLVEEAPAPVLDNRVRDEIASATIHVAEHMGYVNAGTCEFLLDADGQSFYFLEMNTRLQVEHPVTEMVTGIDLAQEQLRIAAGQRLGRTQRDVQTTGHAIEVRVNAEDPRNGFAPTPGVIEHLGVPLGPWVRFDTGVESGYEIPPHYDSMIGKLIVWGHDRDAARARMSGALHELDIRGVPTTASFHRYAIDHPQFAAADHSTMSVEHEWNLDELPAGEPADRLQNGTPMPNTPPAEGQTAREVALTIGDRRTYVTVYGTTAWDDRSSARPRPRDRGDHGGRLPDDGPALHAPMQGMVIKYAVADGDTVASGDLICIVEAMKMENHVLAHRDGTIAVNRNPGDSVERGATLARIEG